MRVNGEVNPTMFCLLESIAKKKTCIYVSNMVSFVSNMLTDRQTANRIFDVQNVPACVELIIINI